MSNSTLSATDAMPVSPSGPQSLALDPLGLTEGGAFQVPEGHQLRFAFNLSTCIGCHACEVACGAVGIG